ncbi:MAG: RdgB/HAM1 family non-canonical purine NTP pyrophosphatase [Bacteroidia bacterium]
MRLLFASNNVDKLHEIRKIMLLSYEIVSLNDVGFTEELPETGTTLEANAMQKAKYVFDKINPAYIGAGCFADDTGLEVDALNGNPGVYSARYAGMNKNANDNIQKLLNELKGKQNRNAQFRTVIAGIINGKEIFCEGVIKGEILQAKKGENGFGYDPVFKPHGYNCSFAEMTLEEKNKVSHRAIAIGKFIEALRKL